MWIPGTKWLAVFLRFSLIFLEPRRLPPAIRRDSSLHVCKVSPPRLFIILLFTVAFVLISAQLQPQSRWRERRREEEERGICEVASYWWQKEERRQQEERWVSWTCCYYGRRGHKQSNWRCLQTILLIQFLSLNVFFSINTGRKYLLD